MIVISQNTELMPETDLPQADQVHQISQNACCKDLGTINLTWGIRQVPALAV